MLTALLLSERNIGTRIIDQHSRTAGHSYACALHPHSLELLDRAGLAYDIIQNSHRIETIGFFRGKDRLAQIKLSDLPSKFPFLAVLEQSSLEDMLEQKLRRFGNIKVNWNHRLAGFEMKEDGVLANVERLAHTGRGYSVPEFEWGVEKEILEETRFVVGADGQNSRCRHCLNIPYHCTGAPERYAVFQTHIEGEVGHEVKIVIDKGVASVMWPLGDGDCRWSFQMMEIEPFGDFPEKDRERVTIVEPPSPEDSLTQSQRFIALRAPWFQEKILSVDWSKDIQFEHRIAAKFGQGRCWLAGDAAHQTSPVGMQSMNIGLKEATDLADRLRRILRENASTDLLQAYDGERRREWMRMLGLSDALKSDGRAAPWLTAQVNTILRCLPSSGDDLAFLLKRLGLGFA